MSRKNNQAYDSQCVNFIQTPKNKKQKKTKTIVKDKRKTRAQEKQIEKVPKIKAKKIQKKNEQDVKKRPRLDLQKFFDPETHEGYLNFACLPSKRP